MIEIKYSGDELWARNKRAVASSRTTRLGNCVFGDKVGKWKPNPPLEEMAEWPKEPFPDYTDAPGVCVVKGLVGCGDGCATAQVGKILRLVS